jgi:hypothetical protein
VLSPVNGPYQSADAAFQRVELLKRFGFWPAVIAHEDGTASLTRDPVIDTRDRDKPALARRQA